ncbi:hypothetical protein CP10139811_0193 [Chlamydia ibidis]|uniref:Uncharacterized protein n=2 Tax=Chlamydia ibidis TaxID=1405396 RepID=S7J536_9CHLA|nr:hypothetical protein [Chlamydia ibidis]EPP35313.1 hypothetical protein CP10139811_0193 [Chlamydia ibidis]EQM62727.1 hypothetical protein H359_0638 [Chlamydia ibidis 10-1398/6]
MAVSFFQRIVFSQSFLQNLKTSYNKTPVLESIINVIDSSVDCCCVNNCLLIDQINSEGYLLYERVKFKKSSREQFVNLILKLLVIPFIVLLIIKVITRIALYLKYTGLQSGADNFYDSVWRSFSQRRSNVNSMYSEAEVEAADFCMPPLKNQDLVRLRDIHNTIRSRKTRSELYSFGYKVYPCERSGENVLCATDEIVFRVSGFPNLQFTSVCRERLDSLEGESAEELIRLNLEELITLQKLKLLSKRGPKVQPPRPCRCRSEEMGEYILIISEVE